MYNLKLVLRQMSTDRGRVARDEEGGERWRIVEVGVGGEVGDTSLWGEKGHPLLEGSQASLARPSDARVVGTGGKAVEFWFSPLVSKRVIKNNAAFSISSNLVTFTARGLILIIWNREGCMTTKQ
jgi:hypothetical protein